MGTSGGDYTNGFRDLGRHERNAEAKRRAHDADLIYLEEYRKFREEQTQELRARPGKRKKFSLWIAFLLGFTPWIIGALFVGYFVIKILLDLLNGSFTS